MVVSEPQEIETEKYRGSARGHGFRVILPYLSELPGCHSTVKRSRALHG